MKFASSSLSKLKKDREKRIVFPVDFFGFAEIVSIGVSINGEISLPFPAGKILGNLSRIVVTKIGGHVTKKIGTHS